jgi:type II secretory pathway pseudopilin PulG
MIVVCIIALLAMVALPNFAKARTSAQVKTCVASLRTMYGAKQEWALDQHKSDNDIPSTADIAQYLAARRLPVCAARGTYNLRRVSRTPTCSLSLKGHTLNNLNLDEDQFPD